MFRIEARCYGRGDNLIPVSSPTVLATVVEVSMGEPPKLLNHVFNFDTLGWICRCDNIYVSSLLRNREKNIRHIHSGVGGSLHGLHELGFLSQY